MVSWRGSEVLFNVVRGLTGRVEFEVLLQVGVAEVALTVCEER